MTVEYKIKWQKPKDYSSRKLLLSLPSPISREMTEIYNYSILEDGFYFLDNLVDALTTEYAFKLFLDEALTYTN